MIVYNNNPIPEKRKRDSLDFTNYIEVLESKISVRKKIFALDKMGYDNKQIHEMLSERNMIKKSVTASHITSLIKSKKKEK